MNEVAKELSKMLDQIERDAQITLAFVIAALFSASIVFAFLIFV